MPDPLLTLDEAAQRATVSRTTIRRRVADGSLPSVRVGPRLLRVRASDLDALLRPVPSASAR